MGIVSFSGNMKGDGGCRAGRRVISFSANPRPSALLKCLREHSGDVSAGSRPECLAVRTILGRTCRFYRNGEHTVEGLPDHEAFDSELLKFAHASLLIDQPVGDKRVLWVDASKNPCEVWTYGMRAETYIARGMQAVDNDHSFEFVVDAYAFERHTFLREARS